MQSLSIPYFQWRVLAFGALLGIFFGKGEPLWWITLAGISSLFLFRWWALFALAFALGAFWGALNLQHQKTFLQGLSLPAGKKVLLEGRLIAPPKEKSTFFEGLFQVSRITWETPKGVQSISPSHLLILMQASTPLTFGKKLQVEGTLSPIKNGFPFHFDYKKFWEEKGVRWRLKASTITPLPESHPFWYGVEALQQLKHHLKKTLLTALPTPHVLLAQGMLFGMESPLPEPEKTRFLQAGLQHLLVVSGSNVMIVLFALWFVLRLFSPLTAFWGTLLGLTLFLFFIGPSPPVLRAVLFGSIVLLGIFWGALLDGMNALLLAALLLGIWNPLMIKYDVSFHLSFFAAAGILIGMPCWWYVSKYLPSYTFRRILGVMLCAQIGVTPVLLWKFQHMAVGGFLANLFAEPLVPFIMLFSFLSALEPLASFSAFWAYSFLELLLFIANIFGKIPPLSLPYPWGEIGMGLLIAFFLWAGFSSTYQALLAAYYKALWHPKHESH